MTRVACAQLDVVFNDPKANADSAVQTLRDCKSQGVDLIVFPECFLTGYCVSNRGAAEEIALQLSPTPPHALAAIWEECRSLGIFAVVGFAQLEGQNLYNSAALIDPNNELKVYQKTHLPELGFDKFATPGSQLPVFETDLGKIGILVCFDLRIPEAARTLALKGAELIVLPTNWPEGAHAGPNFMAAARAGENRVFVATCNRVGTENGFTFIGQSGIYDVTGTTLAKANGGRQSLGATNEESQSLGTIGPLGATEEIITADIDLSIARIKRNIVRPGEFETEMFATRQPSLYTVITE